MFSLLNRFSTHVGDKETGAEAHGNVDYFSASGGASAQVLGEHSSFGDIGCADTFVAHAAIDGEIGFDGIEVHAEADTELLHLENNYGTSADFLKGKIEGEASIGPDGVDLTADATAEYASVSQKFEILGQEVEARASGGFGVETDFVAEKGHLKAHILGAGADVDLNNRRIEVNYLGHALNLGAQWL